MITNAPVKVSCQSDNGVHAATAPDGALAEETGNVRAPSGYGDKLRGKRKAFRAHDTAGEMLAALLIGKVSVESLKGRTGMSESCVRNYVKAFRKSGVIYRCGKEGARQQPGVPARRGGDLFALQPSPFAFPDSEDK